jgi:prepilin-type processing-associated H-X9-DG protein
VTGYGLAPNVITKNLGRSAVGDISDGTSKTICMMEDVGRSETYYTPKYPDPTGNVLGTGGFRNAWRWGDPDTANGVSGPPGTQANPSTGPDKSLFGDAGLKFINNSATPFGGPSWCSWTLNNCGPNDEAYAFHGDGCNVLFLDAHVKFFRSDIDPIALRRLLTPNSQDALQNSDGTVFKDY